MIPKKYRLNAEELKKVVKDGRSVNSENFYAKYTANNMSYSRFSIVISKKTSLLSVGRHLLKRRLSDIIEKSGFIMKNNYDIVIFSKENASKITSPQIKGEILRLLSI